MTATMLCAEALVGFRAWGVGQDGTLMPHLWPTGLTHPPEDLWPADDHVTAHCRSWRHCTAPPQRACTCGFHAYYQVPCDPTYSESVERACAVRATIWGAIAAWGRIVEHELGFRAQYAKPIAVWEWPPGFRNRAAAARKVADHYSIPVLPRDELIAYARWWGEVREGEIVA